MDLLTKICNYLAQPLPSYAEGVDLLETIDQAAGFRRLGYVTPSDRERLREKLQGVADLLSQTSGQPAPKVVAPEPLEPEAIQRLREDLKAALKKRSFLHAEMTLEARKPESEERKTRLFDLAKEIMENVQPVIDRAYDQIQDFEKTGLAPKSGSFEQGEAAARKKASVRASISRYKKLLKSAQTDDERQALEEKILAKSEELLF